MNTYNERAHISTITGVREVGLRGTAELAYWQDTLRSEGLAPLAEGGRAVLMLAAIDATFRGIPFRELSISVALTDGGAFLAHAYNSSRLLAFAERVFFQTPYHLAELTVRERPPARLGVARGGRAVFDARMGDERPPARREEMLFDGPIYLPGGRRHFFARLSGAADVFPFDATDTVTFASQSPGTIFGRLRESGFTGREWQLRSTAVHARTRTFEQHRGRGET